MNAKLALCLLVLPLYSYAMTCPQGAGFSAPQGGLKGEEPYFFTPEGICLNGHDISLQLKRYPDDKITGAFSLGKGMVRCSLSVSTVKIIIMGELSFYRIPIKGLAM